MRAVYVVLIAFGVFVFVVLAVLKIESDNSIAELQEKMETQLSIYTSNFEKLIDGNWEFRQSEVEREDAIGFNFSVIGHRVLNAQNMQNPLAFVRQHIITYKSRDDAYSSYLHQVDWIIVRDWGVPPSRQIVSYQDMVLPDEIEINFSNYRIACLKTYYDKNCVALLLHDNYVVFLDVFLIRNQVEYLSEDQFFNFVIAINNSIPDMD